MQDLQVSSVWVLLLLLLLCQAVIHLLIGHALSHPATPACTVTQVTHCPNTVWLRLPQTGLASALHCHSYQPTWSSARGPPIVAAP